jgi:alkylhydroperoxidase family enzyme
MSQRLKGLSHEDATGVAGEVFAASDRFLGRTSNLVRILSNHSPYIARWFLGLVATVRQPDLGATSDARLRNLANIKTSMTNACTYCTAHTSIYGEGLGIGTEECAALDGDGFKTSPLFSDKEKAVIAWAEAMTRNTARTDKAIWEELKRHCTDVEIVEVSMACAMFNMINRLNDSFWTELETPEYNKKQWNAVRDLSIDDVEVYAGGFAAAGRAQRG